MGAQCLKVCQRSHRLDDAASFGQFYSVGEHIGTGAQGVVYECFNKRSWQKAAVKFVEHMWLSAKDREIVYNEVAILADMNHPYVVQLYDFFQDRSRFYIVMEVCEGGPLLQRMARKRRRKQPYTEKEARDAMRTLLVALAYVHSKDIVHRDVKPENLLMVSKDDDDQLKLADFGLARRVRRKNCLTSQCGTPSYYAPEMVNGQGYGKPVDMWAAGCVMFTLLCGFHPFYHSSTAVMFHAIQQGLYQIDGPPWDYVSHAAKDLLSRLLETKPERRITAAEAMDHPWIRTDDDILRCRSLEAMLDSMVRRAARRRLKAVVYVVIAVRVMQQQCRVRRQRPHAVDGAWDAYAVDRAWDARAMNGQHGSGGSGSGHRLLCASESESDDGGGRKGESEALLLQRQHHGGPHDK